MSELNVFVTIVFKKSSILKTLRDVFNSRNGKKEVNAADLIQNMIQNNYINFKETNKFKSDLYYHENKIWNDVIGVKNLFGEITMSSVSNVEITLRSVNELPLKFLNNLLGILKIADSETYMKGSYEDEFLDFAGVFILGSDYEDIEEIQIDFQDASERIENYETIQRDLSRELILLEDAYLESLDE